jgi:hypothetical protein
MSHTVIKIKEIRPDSAVEDTYGKEYLIEDNDKDKRDGRFHDLGAWHGGMGVGPGVYVLDGEDDVIYLTPAFLFDRLVECANELRRAEGLGNVWRLVPEIEYGSRHHK